LNLRSELQIKMAAEDVFIPMFEEECDFDGFKKVAAKKINSNQVLLVPATEHYFFVNESWVGRVVELAMFPDDCWVVNRCVNSRVQKNSIIYKPAKPAKPARFAPVPVNPTSSVDGLCAALQNAYREVAILREELERAKKTINDQLETIRAYEGAYGRQ